MQENSSLLKILVCYYNAYQMPNLDDKILLPIQAGRAVNPVDLNIQPDNELNGQPCDNISSKNETYSEITGLYWAWKNLRKLYPDVKYVGWSHYRRFFAIDEKKYLTDKIFKPADSIKDYRVNADKIIRILESGKIILSKKVTPSPFSLYINYCINHYSEDYMTLKNIIASKFPDYYDSFINVMEDNNKISLYCMFIMKYDEFEKYCEWLFSVLNAVEPEIPYKFYNPYQQRVLAFMTERLLNVYVAKNNLKPHYSNIYYYETDPAKIESESPKFSHSLFSEIKNKILFSLYTLGPKRLRRMFRHK